MGKGVVLINQSSGYLMVDVVNAYAESYADVVLISGKVTESQRKLNDAVRIEKIIAYNKASVLKRIMTWIIGTIQIFSKILFRYRKYDIVFFTNPPMSYLVALLFPKLSFSVVVYDLYPNALSSIEISKNNLIYRIWGKLNKRIFPKAQKIITLSEGMKDALSEYIEANRIKVIYNWPSGEIERVLKKDNLFIRDNNLQDKFIVLYSGNMGYTHDIDALVNVAEKLRSYKDIVFLFIGEGGKKAMMQRMVKESNLANCRFYTYQPEDMFRYSLTCADIGVVTLSEESAMVSVPSKTYNLLSVGLPLLCIAPKVSELGRLVSSNDVGKCFAKCDVSEMVSYILNLYQNRPYYDIISSNAVNLSQKYTYQNAKMYV